MEASVPKFSLKLLLIHLGWVGLCYFWSGHAAAYPWQVRSSDPKLKTHLESLKETYPDIPHNEALQRLLLNFSQIQALTKAEASLVDGVIVIEAESSKLVTAIEVRTLTRSLRFDIEAKTNKYITQIDSQEMRDALIQDVRTFLHEKGFLKARIKINESMDPGTGLKLDLLVDEDLPCQVGRIDSNFRIPSSVSNPFEVGMDCNLAEIKSKLSELEADLISEGFNLQRIQTPELDYNPVSNTAVLKIKGSLGKKIIYKVVSPIKAPSVVSGIFGDELNTLDSSLTDPDAMASELTRKYQAQGYDDVVIAAPKMSSPDSDTLEYTLFITPGPEYRVVDVQFEGLQSLRLDDAVDVMGLYPSLGNSPVFSQEAARQARDALFNLYRERGYWDVTVFEPRVIKNPSNGEVKLVYVVREGKRRLFHSLSVSGNSALSTDKIRDYFTVETGTGLSWQNIVAFEKAIRAQYRLMGYLQVQLKVDLVQNKDLRDVETKIVVTIEEGRRSRFGEVYIKGLVKTDPVVIRRELRFKPGDWFNPEVLEETRQAINDLGIFSSLSLTPTESLQKDKDGLISYTIIVREARSGTVSFGPGWSREEGLRFSVESSYNNIAGTGRKIFSKGLLNQEKNQSPIGDKTLIGRYAGIGYLEPWLFDLPIDGTLAFNHKAEARDDIWEISRSAEAIVSHRVRQLQPKTLIEVFTLYKETQVEAEGSVKDATLIDSGNLQIREVGLRHFSDARNSIGWPTRGYRVTTELSTANYVFGGGIRYYKWGLGYNVYKEIVPDLVFAAGMNYTAYQDVARRDGTNVLPSSERLTVGGPENNRGFRENSLGPVFVSADGKQNFDGGSQRSSHRLELRYQVIADTIAATLFFDSSNSSFSKAEESRINDEHSSNVNDQGQSPQLLENNPYHLEELLKHPDYIWNKNYASYGVAGNYLTPLGSVNLALGWPLRRCLTGNECQVPRGTRNYSQPRGAVFSINIGANF